MNLETIRVPLRKFWQRLQEPIGGEVPEDMAFCEYDCRKVCTEEEWAICTRRIQDAEKRAAARVLLQNLSLKTGGIGRSIT